MESLTIYLSQSLAKELALDEIKWSYERLFTSSESPYLSEALYHASLAFTILRKCSTPYHNQEHTLNVLSCGLSLLEGKHLKMGSIKESEWANVVVSLCYHDIGYVRKICFKDTETHQVISESEETIVIPPFATDAFLTPYHVERSVIFAKEKVKNSQLLDSDFIAECIRQTNFDLEADENSLNEDNVYPKIVQAADLVGQLGDLNYFNNLPLLFFEFKETGVADELSIESANALRANYPKFFKNSVLKKISETLPLLQVTKRGELWISKLNYNLFSEDNRVKISRETQKIMADLIYTLRTSGSSFQAYTNLLKIVCEHYLCQIGHIYLVDSEDQKLKSSGIWYNHDSDLERFKTFKDITERLEFSKGEGFPGEIFEINDPKWISNLSSLGSKEYPRAQLFKELRLKSAIGFPLSTGKKVIGIVELFSSRIIEPSEKDLNFIRYLTAFVARINTREN